MVTIGVATFFLLIIGLVITLKRPKKLKTQTFIAQWKELQGQLRDPSAWASALIEADKMLDKALKKRKLKGKTMGERLVSAQRMFTDNDDVWFAHNLAKKVAAGGEFKLKESDVKDALLGFRDALKDIGALQFASKDSENTAGKKS
jgi:hypothetical protein